MIQRCLLLSRGALLACALVLLVACAGSDGTAGEPPGAGGALPDPPIERLAECAFPQEMQVGRPATVRFSIFTADNQPNALPDATSVPEALSFPARPDLEVWVAVSLTANGEPVAFDSDRRLQRLSETSNIWIWQLTPDEAAPLVLQPIVDVEYRDANGRIIEQRSNVWTDTYTVENVVGPGALNVAGAWLGDSVSDLIASAIGGMLMTFVITPARTVIGRRFGRSR